jgi:hypothetical protein
MQKLRIVTLGISGGRWLTRPFRDAADSPLQDCSPYSHVHVRRESVGFVHRSRAILCRPVPNPNGTIRCCVAVRYARPRSAWRPGVVGPPSSGWRSPTRTPPQWPGDATASSSSPAPPKALPPAPRPRGDSPVAARPSRPSTATASASVIGIAVGFSRLRKISIGVQ